MKTETSRDERVTKTQTSRLTDRQIERQGDRKTGRQTDSQIDGLNSHPVARRARESYLCRSRAGHGTGYGTCRTKVTTKRKNCSKVQLRTLAGDEGGGITLSMIPYTRTHT